ncbi:phosphomannomutase/phosphoglucomutase [Patescibacteria group bacterium]
MKVDPGIFRNYDVRAIIPEEMDWEGLERFAQATNYLFRPKKVVIGFDARLTGKKISALFSRVFQEAGVEVVDLGQVSTDMVYFASGIIASDLFIMVTASHNPPEYNGFKMTLAKGVKVSGDQGFYKIRDLILSNNRLKLEASKKGNIKKVNIYKDWIDFCLSFIDQTKLKPLKVVVDAGNGIGGKLFGHQYLLKKLPIKLIPLYFELDGSFPNHIPNPLKPENLEDIKKKVISSKADLGFALDGDGDRITLITEKGEFVRGGIITALIADSFLSKNPKQTILYNAVVGRIVREIVKKRGGKSKRVRVGYSLIEKEMKKTGAVFAGEHSCHFMYRDVNNSEASLLTYLILLEAFSDSSQPVSRVVKKYWKYPQSGEINFEVEDKQATMKKISQLYQKKAEKIDWLDGLTIWFKNGWVSIRPSNTQPLLRLNVEADNKLILKNRVREFVKQIESLGGIKSKD